MARLARIYHKIHKQLFSAAALMSPVEELVPVRDSLAKELRAWRESLPDISHPCKPLRAFAAGPHVHLNQALFVRFSYFDAVSALHRRFAASYLFSNDHYESSVGGKPVEQWRPISVEKSIEAARQIILLTRHIEVESYTPTW
jgi:hypothetical protein